MRPQLEVLVWGGSSPVPSAEWLDERVREIAAHSYRLSKETVLGGIMSGETWVWYVGEPASGLVLLQIVESEGQKTLVLFGLSGENVVTQCQAIGRDLRKIALEYNCTNIETMTTDPRWKAVADRLGFSVAYTTYSLEV